MIFARNDICAVIVGEAHGGCAQPHKRPPGDGPWALECPACEVFLRTDQNWSVTWEKLPETFDETQQREAAEQHIARRSLLAIDQAAGLLAALAGPRDVLLGAQPAIAAGPPCRKCGGGVAPSARFCGTCGAPALRQIEGAA